MDTQNLDGYFTNLLYEMEANRCRRHENGENAYREPQPPQSLAGISRGWLDSPPHGSGP